MGSLEGNLGREGEQGARHAENALLKAWSARDSLRAQGPEAGLAGLFGLHGECCFVDNVRLSTVIVIQEERSLSLTSGIGWQERLQSRAYKQDQIFLQYSTQKCGRKKPL
jgi:hypothetical protein